MKIFSEFLMIVAIKNMIHDRFVLLVQQLLELQELYNSQQQLTAELTEKLEKTEV